MATSPAVDSGFDVASFITEYYGAWSGTNEDHILSYYTDNVVLHIPGVIMEGKEAIRDQFVRPFITAFPGNWHRVKHIFCGQGVANVEFTFEAEHTGSFKGHAATGARVVVPGCGVYEFDSERRQLSAARIYFDMGTLLQAITAFSQTDRQHAAVALHLSERNLSLIVNTIPTLAWSARPDGYGDFLNQRWLDYTGMTTDQAVGWGWGEAIHPDDRKGVIQYWQSCLASGVPGETEARMRRFDGAYRWFLFRASPLRDESGTVVKWYGINIDIDDRRRGEEALRASERNLNQILNAIPTVVGVMRADGTPLYGNQGVTDYVGLTREELQRGDFRPRTFHPEDLERLREARRVAFTRPVPFENEIRVLGKDGIYRAFLFRYKPLLDEAGTIDRWFMAALDIEDRKRAEEALQARELDARSLLDNMPGFLGRHSPDGTPEIVNRPFLQYHGKTIEEIGQWRTSDVIHPEDHAHVVEGVASGISGGQPWDLEFRLRRFDGTYRWFQARWVPVRDGEGRLLHWNALTTDIDDRKQAEEALARQAGVRGDVSAAFAKPTHLGEILRGCTEAIVRHLDAAFARIWLLNKDERVLELQASAGIYTRLDGSYSRIPVGDLKVGLIAREKKAHFTNDVLNDPRVNDKGWARQNGMVAFAGYPLVVEEELIGVVALFARRPLPGSILDTLASVADTIAQGVERKRAEEALTRSRSELVHMARVTTLSALTASIAHDVNQPIAAAITSAGACLRWLNRDQPDVQRAREAVMRIEDDGRRAAEIITHLKSFYKKEVLPQRVPVPVNDLVDEMLALLCSEAHRHSVVMRTELTADLPAVSADRVQLQQVLMNLMLNGMEAMGERGGELKISTWPGAGVVRVAVTDTGIGIPADKMDHIFSAFFTTKTGGTGMGLAISRTIIESHGGRVWATVNPDRGATFHFTLPTDPEA